ncbi:MAG TPA: hypothetical protein VN025_05885 [Candidatus Dormibacteraeota bacterium]|jgi:hypothetical protein|nr:hypothetical protein [Candidatus Dormibacteraeota bacterium]
MRLFIGHKLIGGFFVGASFRPRLHAEIPHPNPAFSWLVLIGTCVVLWEVFHWIVR